MANVPALPSLKSRDDWQIIDQSLLGNDFRLRLIKRS